MHPVPAGPVGRHASAGTDWTMNTEILTYSRSHGIFAGITLNGAVVEEDADSTRAIYGSDPSFRSILFRAGVRAPAIDAELYAGDCCVEAGRSAGTIAELRAHQQ